MQITPKDPNQTDPRTPKKRGRPRKNDPAKIAPQTEKEKGDLGDREKSVLQSIVSIAPNITEITDRNEKINAVIALIDEGYDLRQIEKLPNMPSHQAICLWMQSNTNNVACRYAQARERRADRLAREIMDIADECDKRDPAAVNKARLQTDVRKWYLSHILPEKYGDLQRLELTGKNGGPVAVASVGAVAIAEAQQLRSLIFGTSQPEPEAIEAKADDVPQQG